MPSQRIEYTLADEVSSASRGGALPHAAPPSPDYTKQVRTGKTMCISITLSYPLGDSAHLCRDCTGWITEPIQRLPSALC